MKWSIIDEIVEFLSELKEKFNEKSAVVLWKLKKDSDTSMWLEVNFPKLNLIFGDRGNPLSYLSRESDAHICRIPTYWMAKHTVRTMVVWRIFRLI